MNDHILDKKVFLFLCILPIAFVCFVCYTIDTVKDKEVIQMKVKDYKVWRRIVFGDRVIIRTDLSLMSAEQRNALMEMDVVESKSNRFTLVVSNK